VHIPLEVSIDLTAQELLSPPELDFLVEVDDVCDVDPLLRTGAFVANSDLNASAELNAPAEAIDASDDSVSIELTAEQMDALLEGDLPF
jgi:hypothetical protein